MVEERSATSRKIELTIGTITLKLMFADDQLSGVTLGKFMSTPGALGEWSGMSLFRNEMDDLMALLTRGLEIIDEAE